MISQGKPLSTERVNEFSAAQMVVSYGVLKNIVEVFKISSETITFCYNIF